MGLLTVTWMPDAFRRPYSSSCCSAAPCRSRF